MKIVIDARMWNWSGIGRVTRNLVRQLEELDRENQYIVLMLEKDKSDWTPTAPNFHKELVSYRPYGLGEQLGLAWHLYRLRPDLVHFPHFNLPVAYFGRYVVSINDLTLIHFQNVRGRGLAKLIYQIKYWAMRLVFRHAVMVSKHLITLSHYVKKDLLVRYGRDPIRRLKAAKITPIHLAVDPNITEPADIKRIVTGPFLLYVGNSYPHKNLQRLTRAFADISAQRPDLSLVLVGQDDYFYNQLRENAKDQPKIHFPGFVSDGELAGLYRQAELFVLPSLSEGFGLPALEAMVHGTPVITANTTSLPEVCGPAAAYFDPTDTKDVSAKILELLNNKKELDRLRQAGPEHVKQFSWQKMATETLEVYNQALGSRQ